VIDFFGVALTAADGAALVVFRAPRYLQDVGAHTSFALSAVRGWDERKPTIYGSL
jgi:hypothetical protein